MFRRTSCPPSAFELNDPEKSIPEVRVPLGALKVRVMTVWATPFESRITLGPFGSALMTACAFWVWIRLSYL